LLPWIAKNCAPAASCQWAFVGVVPMKRVSVPTGVPCVALAATVVFDRLMVRLFVLDGFCPILHYHKDAGRVSPQI
jgi:hypothetical protein